MKHRKRLERKQKRSVEKLIESTKRAEFERGQVDAILNVFNSEWRLPK